MGLPEPPIQDWPETVYLSLFLRVQRQNFIQLQESKVLSLDMFTRQLESSFRFGVQYNGIYPNEWLRIGHHVGMLCLLWFVRWLN